MKKFLTILSSCFILFKLAAQQPANGGFELWANGTPQSWSTSHSCIPASTLESKDSITPYQGTDAIKLVTGNVPAPASMLYPGFVNYGPASWDNNAAIFVTNAVPFAYRPDSLQFAYKYAPVGGDSANVFCLLSKGGPTNMVGLINSNLPASANYKLVTMAINYTSSQVPDSLELTFYSGSILIPHSGSAMHLDAVKFIYIGANAIESLQAMPEISVFPNPASATLYVRTDEKYAGGTLKIFSLLGNEVLEYALSGHDAISISMLPSALYIYSIIDAGGKAAISGKFTKQ